MLVGIISDIHDNITNIRAAARLLRSAEVIICCGDLCSPFIVDELGKGFAGKDIHVVFGNNDADLFRITLKAGGYGQMALHGEFCELELDGKRFAVNHFDNIARALAKSDAYDVVCFGHNHQVELSQAGATRLINPGEVFGGLTGKATVVLYDTATDDATVLAVV